MRYDLNTHTLTPFLPGFSAEWLSFTRDGQRMAYIAFPGENLWESNVDGNDRRQLTFPPMQAGGGTWSPDGSQIAFTGAVPGKPGQVFVIPYEGGNPEQLTSGDVTKADPTWSPDGNFLAFAGPWDSKPTRFPIQILNLKTHEGTDVPNSAGIFSPGWPPDGRDLLGIPLGPGGLMLYDFQLRSWQRLSSPEIPPPYPSWSPDGKCVYFN